MALLLSMKKRLLEHSWENVFWLINFLPNGAGFSFRNKRVKVSFWILHILLTIYVYIIGSVVYQIYYAKNTLDVVNNFFNVSIVVTVLNDTMWLVLKRNKIKYILKLSLENDSLILETSKFMDKYKIMLRNLKVIVLICYTFHFVNDVIIFTPSRVLDMKSYSIANCVGLETVANSTDEQICMFLLALQELKSIFVVATKDVIVLFLFSHTTAVFQVLCEDMENFSRITGTTFQTEINLINDTINNIINRHSLITKTVCGMQDLFGVAIGIGFALNAVSLCLFFVLPIKECLQFIPLICYYLFVFLLYCYLGQRLTNASEMFERAVYCCGWQYLDVKEQKSILLILKQAQKPVTLHAANIVPISMFTFAGVMQNIYKFVAAFKI